MLALDTTVVSLPDPTLSEGRDLGSGDTSFFILVSSVSSLTLTQANLHNFTSYCKVMCKEVSCLVFMQ